MDPHTESRLSELEPTFAADMSRLLDRAYAAGIDLRVTQGLRSWNMQAALYAGGRETTEQVNARRLAVGLSPLTPSQNIIVTHAPPGHGWHEYGMAGDVAPFDKGQPNWDESSPEWAQVISIGEGIGLRSGSLFRTIRDGPHFQPFHIPESPTDETRQTFQGGGMSAVWEMYKVASGS